MPGTFPAVQKQWRLRPRQGAKRDLLSLHELTVEEMENLLRLAAEVKAQPTAFSHALQGQSLALVFEKPSLRTRVTFEVGMTQLGGHAVYLAPADVGLGQRESVRDVARNLGRWVQGIVVRTFGQAILEEMAAATAVPVINALTDLLHPCQALADLLTLQQHRGRLQGLRLAYVGDGNNVAHSLLHAAARAGIHLTLACPLGYQPDSVILAQALETAPATGAILRVVQDPAEAVRDADAVYTDVWTSMGQEAEAEQRRRVFAPYQVNADLMKLAKPDALFLHCLPAHRGEEVTDDVLDGPHSVVLDQAENRLYVAKAVLLALLSEVST